MAIKEIKSRIIHKHDIEANWNKAVNFIPMQGEIIIYDIDSNYDFERAKIGDGVTSVVNLPFYLEHEIDTVLAQLTYLKNNTIDANYENGKLIITKGITFPENLT